MNLTKTIIRLSSDIWLKSSSLHPQKLKDFISEFYQLLTREDSHTKIQQAFEAKYGQILLGYIGQDWVIYSLIAQNNSQITAKIISLISPQRHSLEIKRINNAEDSIKYIEVNCGDYTLRGYSDWKEVINHNTEIKPHEYRLQDDDFFCDFILDQNQQKQWLITSKIQQEIINKTTPFPTILTGYYGVGKTTTAIYSAIKQAKKLSSSGEEKLLYVTENKTSIQQIQHSSNNICICENIDFYSILYLCKTLIKKYPLIFTRKFLSQRQITLSKFTEQFFKSKKIIGFKAEDIWQEFKFLLKGSSKALKSDNGIISLPDYLAQKNQSILPENSDFNLIHNLAVQYQQWLDSQNYWDELDITRYLLVNLPANYLGEYMAIYMDEVEHLPELQLEFILKLLKYESPNNYLPQIFIIDNKEASLQSHSQRENRIKKLLINSFYKLPQWKKIRELIEPQELTQNFIYTQNITNLAGAIAHQAGVKYNHNSLMQGGSKPLVISDITADFLTDKSALNLDSAIVVFEEEERQKLVKIFPQDSERIILFSTVENLKFKQVLVWKLFSHINQQNRSQNLTEEEVSFTKYDTIFTCTKIAQQSLYFCDEVMDDFWSYPAINRYVDIGYETELTNVFDYPFDTEELNRITDEYLNLGTIKGYNIAREIYENYHNNEGLLKVSALLEERKGNYGQAGDIWNNIGIFDQAITCWNEVDEKLWTAKWSTLDFEQWQKRGNYFEQKGDFSLAELCYEKAEDLDGKLRCLERNNQWELAGDECQKKNLPARSYEYYQIAHKYYCEQEQDKLAIKMWTRLGKWDQVALIWENLQQWEKAGNCWQKQGDISRAASCWQKGEKWAEAQKCWEELGNWEELALSYEQEENWLLAAQTWLKVDKKELGAFCYQKGNYWQEAENLWRQLGYWGFVAIALQQQGKWEEAAQAWNNTNPHELQGLCYEQSQQWDKAEKCWLEAKNWTRIILACEKQEKWQEAAESWENLGEWQKAGFAWEKINDVEKAALCYQEGGNWHLAEECWRKLNRSEPLAEILEKQGKWEEAAQRWENLGQWEKAAQAWKQIEFWEKAALCYEEVENWRFASQCWEKLKNWERMDNACKKDGTWQKAAFDWIVVHQLEKAALCYENCGYWEEAARYWKESGKWDKYAYACEQIKQWEEAATGYLKIEEREKAALCYEKSQQWEKAEECWQKLWKWERVAFVCEYQHKWKEAAKAWTLVSETEKAALCYEKGKIWDKAEECWQKVNNWEKMAEVCERQEKWEEAAQLWQFLQRWEKAALVCLKMNDVETAIKYYQKGGYTEEVTKYQAQLSLNS